MACVWRTAHFGLGIVAASPHVIFWAERIRTVRFVGSFPAACGQPHSSCLFPSQALFCALDLFVLAPHLPNSLAIRRHGSHSASACSKSSNARATPIPP